jgi:hypothetical protein
LAFGAQNGLNFSNEMFDNLSEYAPLFGKMGFSADEYFQLLIKGSKAGVYNLDYINDLMKENQIRLKDGSKATTEAMGQLSGSTQKVWKDMLAGKATVKDVHNVVIKELKGMDDQTKANNIAVGLYGTKFEDLEADAVYSLGNIDGKLQDVDGSMKNATQSIEEAFGTRVKKAWREAQSALLPLGETLLDVAEDALPAVADTVQDVTNAFEKMDPEMQKTILAIGGVTAIAGPAVYTIGMLTTGVGALIGAVTPLATAIGTGGLAGAFTVLTGPVGLTVAGLGLATGAVFALKGAMDESKDVNFEYASSLIDQHNELNNLIPAYDSLREKNQLSNDELLRFRDIQEELQTAKAADEIKKLKDEAERLQEKSGLSNEKLSEMLDLNDLLIEKVPEAGQAFSEQGNSILKNTDDLSLANEALRENIRLELESQQIKLDAKLDENIRKQIDAQQELNNKVIELNNAMIEGAAQEYQLNQLKQEQQDAYAAGQDYIAEGMNFEIERLEIGIQKQNNKVAAVANEVQEKKKAVDETGKEITETQKLYDEMINLQLAQVGINSKGQEGINLLGQAISKTQARIGELNQVKREQGGLNAAQQKELDNLNSVLGKHREAQSEIRGIQSEQNTVNSKIDAGSKKAGEMSDILSKSEVKNIKFSGDGYSKAQIISNEADKDVTKAVNVTDYGKANAIHKNAEKGASKTVTIKAAVSSGFKVAVKAFETMSGINIPGFKTGTRNAPGGMAWVGEEGPELMYVPKGASIIPNPQSEQILRSWNVPVENAKTASIYQGANSSPASNTSPVTAREYVAPEYVAVNIHLDSHPMAKVLAKPVKAEMDLQDTLMNGFKGVLA